MKAEILRLLDEIDEIADEAVIEKVAKIREMMKKVPKGKAKHRFQKSLSETPFFVDYNEAKAEIYWEKVKVFRIKKGAKLRKTHLLTAKGELSLGDRFGEALRIEQENNIHDFVLTEDVFLKSPNEIGHFLYFGGVDPWKMIKDKTLLSLGEISEIHK
ncbi:MAG: hypothetical protein LBD38_05500 [Streptococcaceae bacterium]|jgi:hypothetical protein|nr:hypothetical protein [Streptococcaceae bacterium]